MINVDSRTSGFGEKKLSQNQKLNLYSQSSMDLLERFNWNEFPIPRKMSPNYNTTALQPTRDQQEIQLNDWLFFVKFNESRQIIKFLYVVLTQ
jgi:hypothetical protein